MAIKALVDAGIVKAVISQNTDGLQCVLYSDGCDILAGWLGCAYAALSRLQRPFRCIDGKSTRAARQFLQGGLLAMWI